jgi:hypothetical protein
LADRDDFSIAAREIIQSMFLIFFLLLLESTALLTLRLTCGDRIVPLRDLSRARLGRLRVLVCLL